MTGTYDHRACGKARKKAEGERDAARAELAELRTVHETLLEEILGNAGEDIKDADEAREYLAEEYVRHLERECDRLRELLNEARIADTEDRDSIADHPDDCPGSCCKDALREAEADADDDDERDAEEHARDMAAEDGDFDDCEPTL